MKTPFYSTFVIFLNLKFEIESAKKIVVISQQK
jgi:hypothetical protein